MKVSLESGVVPADWKDANVTPICKKGSKSQVGNYRQVSLTCQIDEVFESVIRDAIVDHLDRNRLLNSSQHGFRKGGSCLGKLRKFLEKVTTGLNNQNTLHYLRGGWVLATQH